MTQYYEYLHQIERAKDYKDRISSGLFQINQILTTYFPEQDDSSLRDMMRIFDTDFTDMINKLPIAIPE